jgi:chromosome partitioning protein
MRVDPRTRAAGMLEEFLKHFDIPIVAYLRNTQNYVNVAAGGDGFDPPRAKHRRDLEQWASLIEWLQKNNRFSGISLDSPGYGLDNAPL